MNELLFSNQANGDKEMSTNDYDRSREVHAAQSGVTRMSTRTLATELCCPICLDLLTTTMTTKECLHRFCADCITTALLRGNKECPTCRKKLVSKRSLRADPNFDMLISKIWPDRQLYEKMQSKAMETFTMKNNTDSLRTSIEEGMKAQAASRRQRVAGSYDLERSGNTTTTGGASRKRKRGEEGEMEEVVDGNGTPPDEMEDGEQLDGVATQNSATPSSASSEDDDEWRKEEWASLIPADDDLDNTAVMATYMAVDVSADDSADESDSDSSSGSSSSSSHSSLASSSHMSSVTLEPSPEPIVAPPVVAPSPPMPAFENIQPPGEVCTLKDRMHKWLSDNPSTPPMEDQLHEQLERRFNTDDEMDEQSQGSAGDEEWTEIECELIPAACLSRRNPPAALLTPRYFKTRLDTTMDHLTEFIRQCVEEETPDEKCPLADHFYVFSRHGGHHMRRIFSHETMQVAQCAMTKDDHLIIFYDTEPSDLRIQHSLLENIVPAEFLSQPIV